MKQLLILFLSLMMVPFVAYGHGGENHAKRQAPKRGAPVEEKTFGREGDPKNVTRTVRIEGRDTMRYTPSRITVKQGETVRFVVRNGGKLMHETVLGTKEELSEHYELMKKFPDMEHDEPHMVHLKPGETGEMFWQFTRAGEFYFACLIPGHYEAGMFGTIAVTAK
jgi:uncharacterized cupredoxin-like copper-binding protein